MITEITKESFDQFVADRQIWRNFGEKETQIFPKELPEITEPWIISYDDFTRRFLFPNVPCLIKGNPIEDWNSRTDWVSSDGTPNLKFFTQILPENLMVPVSNCDKKYFNSQEKCDMLFEDYCSFWNSSRKDKSLYLKDWHFHRDVPSYKAYRTPVFFSSDWLNEYLESSLESPLDRTPKDDFRFVYVGPKNSWTPLHFDVYGSYSWSANVVGRKRWIFFPPGQEKFLKDGLGKLVYDVNNIDQDLDVLKYEVIQESGDIVFVPSLWHHQVENLEDTISINHNWFNAFNVDSILQTLFEAQDEVERELQDCKETVSSDQEWSEICQKVLKANHGMNFQDFVEILSFIAEKRLDFLRNPNNENCQLIDDHRLGPNHAEFDLFVIRKIFEEKLELIKSKALHLTVNSSVIAI